MKLSKVISKKIKYLVFILIFSTQKEVLNKIQELINFKCAILNAWINEFKASFFKYIYIYNIKEVYTYYTSIF